MTVARSIRSAYALAWLAGLAGLAGLAFASGCAARGPTLVVSVITDLAPAADFAGVRVSVESEGVIVAERERVATRGSWITPHDVAIVDDLPPGRLDIQVELLDAYGDPVLARRVIDTHSVDRAITVVLEASCYGIDCSEGEECRAGLCRDVCDDCVPLCTFDDDCPESPSCGAGVCGGGVCVYPEGPDRCEPGEICDASSGCRPAITVQCHGAADCPSAVIGSWSRCEPDDPSDCSTGERAREVTRYTCVDARCEPSTTTERSACVPDPARCETTQCRRDEDCPDAIVGSWSECAWAGGSTCGVAGERRREVTTFHCAEAHCVGDTVEEAEACTRNTNGVSCGESGCGPWGDCRYDACAETGIRYRYCANPRCAGGVCNSNERTESEACSRGPQHGLACVYSALYGSCAGTCNGTSCEDLCAHCGPGAICNIFGCTLDGYSC